MTTTPPPVGPNLQNWARATRAYLQRWMPRLQWKTQDSNPSENGIMLWDEENKNPIVSVDNNWRPLTIFDAPGISNYYMNGNATATTIATAGVAVKVAGTTTSGSLTQKFSNSVANRAEYTGGNTRTFQINVQAAVTSGSSKVIGLYVAENGTAQPQFVGRATTSAGGRAESMSSSGVFELATNDYLEVWVANETDTASVTVEDLNVLVTEV